MRTLTVEHHLAAAGRARRIIECDQGEVLFSEGDVADSVMYVRTGLVKLSVLARREAIVGMFGPGGFFGEEGLADHATRQRGATVMTRSSIFVVETAAMRGLLRDRPLLAQHFQAHLLARKQRLEDDLIDQVLSTCEQRLARILLLLAQPHQRDRRQHAVPTLSQTTLADIVGCTRPQAIAC